MVYRGYPAALSRVFREYIEKDALAPLVAELRKWNWEWGYSDYLLELTECLQKARHWPLLKELWAGVIAKRRTNYNKIKKAQRAVPDKIPEDLVTRTRELLNASPIPATRRSSGRTDARVCGDDLESRETDHGLSAVPPVHPMTDDILLIRTGTDPGIGGARRTLYRDSPRRSKAGWDESHRHQLVGCQPAAASLHATNLMNADLGADLRRISLKPI